MARELRVDMDGIVTGLTLDADEVERHYRPIVSAVLGLRRSAARLIVGVAGPPGSGKTAFSYALASLLNSASDNERAVVIGLDGWHYGAGYLATHYTDQSETPVPLAAVKGAPETFDVRGAISALRSIREGMDLECPVYSRQRHEPIEAGVRVGPEHSIVVFEGNYLLLDSPAWNGLRQSLDFAILLAASDCLVRFTLHERHQRGGRPRDDAERWIENVDMPNAHLVMRHSVDPDLLIVKADTSTIARVVSVTH